MFHEAAEVVVVVVVVFTLNRPFYPSTSAEPPVSFLVLHPSEIKNDLMTDNETEKNQTVKDSRNSRQVKC